jgi:hypothetical protein
MDPATDPLEEVEAFLAAGVGLWPNVALGLEKCVRDNRDPIAEANSSVDIIDANRRERH